MILPNSEWRVIGPPGTGKTTHLIKTAFEWAETIGGSNIIVVTLTRAAANEFRQRCSPNIYRVSTLHSLCYHYLREPRLVEEQIDEWNLDYSEYKFSRVPNEVLGNGPASSVCKTFGDRLLSHLDILRNKSIPKNEWTQHLLCFEEIYTNWKIKYEYFDYTDLIEICLRSKPTAPESPKVIIVDEAQDSSPLELKLLRSWGKYLYYLLLAGDPDQAIYTFRGVEPSKFTGTAIDNEKTIVLGQSYRLSKSVHAFAASWIRLIPCRSNPTFEPTEIIGNVRKCSSTLFDLHYLLDDIEIQIADKKKVMVLTSCSYMLNRVVKSLRRNNIPFHNPYRPERLDWNPLAIRRQNGTPQIGYKGNGQRRKCPKRYTRLAQLLSFFKPNSEITGQFGRLWTWWDVGLFMPLFEEFYHLPKYKRSRLSSLRKSGEPISVVLEKAAEICKIPTQLAQWAIEGNIEAVVNSILPTKRRSFEFALRLVRQHGLRVLHAEPQVIVGTIHSVKGGEADTVYIFPDLSSSGMLEWESSQEGRDSIVRQFYVGITRAKSEVVICNSSSKKFVRGLI